MKNNLKKSLLAVLLFIPITTIGSENKYFILNHFDLEYQSSFGTNRTFLVPPDRQKIGSLATNFNIHVAKYVYSRNRVETYLTNKQFSYVGLKTEMGISAKRFEFFVNHYSGHCMDCIYKSKYPNENSIGFRVNLLEEK